MEKISTVGLDLAKSVFQVHAIAETGEVLVRRSLRRSQVLAFFGRLAPCRVGLEACGSAHYWARAIQALGHRVKMLPPAYVKPYIKRNKADAADAAAICEAVSRPTMRFVPVKTVAQQAAGMGLKTREVLLRQRVQLTNALRGHTAELGATGVGVEEAGCHADDPVGGVSRRSPRRLPEADICIAAGDIAKGAMNSIDWLRETIAPHMPVVFVMGNHEFYSSSIERERHLAREYAPHAGVHLLDEDVLELNGIRFIGTTLWTDYAPFGGEESTVFRSMAAAEHGLNDHRRIRSRDFSSVRFSPTHAKEMHQSSIKFIEGALAVPFGGQSVVVTHHCPHPLSIAERYKTDPLTPAFCSDLSETIERYEPALWIHGHTHMSFDYTAGNTRIVCNPRGYWNENSQFNAALVIETD